MSASFRFTLLLFRSCESWLYPPHEAQPVGRRIFRPPILFSHYGHQSLIWVSSEEGDGWEASGNDEAGLLTLRWCHDVVVPLNLCPWAPFSLQTRNAVEIYCVPQREDMNEAVEDVSRLFNERIEKNYIDPTAAISFLVCEDRSWTFQDFFEWFCDLEEDYWDDEDALQGRVTLAAFHPEWVYADEKESALFFEKRSPLPTVTLVSTAVVEAAGKAATSRIAQQNEETLLQKTIEEMEDLYEEKVYLKRDAS